MPAACRVLGLLALVFTAPLLAADIERFFMPGPLIAGHKGLEAECTNCHERLRELTQNVLCLSCHDHRPILDDIRDGSGFHGKDRQASSQDCSLCHTDHKGEDARIVLLDEDRFDHRLTDFELIGRHRLAECTDCHRSGEKHREAEQECHACHAEDDFHEGELGERCADCHSPVSWHRSEFDHDRTDFPLRESHRGVVCSACHRDERYADTPGRCVDCHAIRDVHENRFGNDCADCHGEQAWDRPSFDHERDTDYPLEGEHGKVADCNRCHQPDYRAKKVPDRTRTCIDCHRGDDVHEGANGDRCQQCHTVIGWEHAEFDHDRNTDFALNGAHEKLACAACHELGAESREIDTACYSCHRLDDAHESENGERCESCHNEIDWRNRVRFDHDLTRFPLIGQHAVATCESCHLTSVFKAAESDCVDCHRGDDVHREALGTDCATCHNANDWLIWFFDHDATGFELRDAHDGPHCHSCHFRPLRNAGGKDRDCADCHWRDDVHRGAFGRACDGCHGSDDFSSVDVDSLRSNGVGLRRERAR